MKQHNIGIKGEEKKKKKKEIYARDRIFGPLDWFLYQERAKVKRSTCERGDCSKVKDSNTCFSLEEVGSFGILHFPWQKTMAILRLFSNANVVGRERGFGFFFIGLAVGRLIGYKNSLFGFHV